MKVQIVAASLLVIIAAACADEDRADADKSVEPAVAVKADEPAYFVFNYHISDREAYTPYLAQVPETLEAYGAEIVVANFDSEIIEGDAGGVTVVLKFASEEIARNWYGSPQYQKIIELRTANSSGIATLVSAVDD